MNKNIKLAVAGAVLALSASANAGIEKFGCKKKVSVRRSKMFGALAMAMSHAGLHHHSS